MSLLLAGGAAPATDVLRPVLKPLYRFADHDRYATAVVNLRRPSFVAVQNRYYPLLKPLYTGHERAVRTWMRPWMMWHPQPFTTAAGVVIRVMRPLYTAGETHGRNGRYTLKPFMVGPQHEAVPQRNVMMLRPLTLFGSGQRIPTVPRMQNLWHPHEEPPVPPVGKASYHHFFA
jgi:hypothetical protein